VSLAAGALGRHTEVVFFYVVIYIVQTKQIAVRFADWT